MEEKLKKYLNSGYLVHEDRLDLLVKEKKIRLHGKYKEPVIICGSDEYIRFNNEIDAYLHSLRHKKAGTMGINTSLVEKDVNKIDTDRLTKIKNTVDEINPDQIDF